jgi:hypothetical protein
MSILRKGSTGSEVKQLQESLRGSASMPRARSVTPPTRRSSPFSARAACCLTASSARLRARDDAACSGDPDTPVNAGPKVDRSVRLSARNYISDVYPERSHRASPYGRWIGPKLDQLVGEPEQPHRDRLRDRARRHIHEVFDPRFWAYHLGVQGVGAALDRRSIGIELACEGPVTQSGNGYTAFNRAIHRQGV